MLNNNLPAEIKSDRFENGKAIYSSTDGLYNKGDGDSYGLELMLRKETGIVSGWLSYSYSKTEYKFDKINSQKIIFTQTRQKPYSKCSCKYQFVITF
ncbi:MAG: hypothetical protein IPJ75_09770 [Ignavibacteriales bacterium]|nr:hypothetical protein [Ignavibacteriales bacterium]